MKKRIKNFFYVRRAIDLILRFIPDKAFTKLSYRLIRGETLNLKNPKLFSEKINWLKLNDRTSLHTICADKYKVRSIIKEKIGEHYLIPLVLETKNVNDIKKENLPDYPVIIKTNHDSGTAIIVKDKDNVDYKIIRKKLKISLKSNFYYRTKEWQYKNIEPRIIVEKLLVCNNGDIPNDIKLHCINGSVEVIQIDIDRFNNHKRNLYDKQWKLLPFTWSVWLNNQVLWDNGKDIEKPQNLKEMIDISEKLSKKFKMCRIDLYDVDGKIYFGEITFHHGSGFEIIYPKQWDKKLGDMLKLNLDEK